MIVPSRLRILLIDDDVDECKMLTQMLRTTAISHDLDCASSIDEALGALSATSFDVCLVDYSLGRERGSEFIRAAIERGCDAAMIMVTGYSDTAVSIEALQAGATDFLVKGQIDRGLLERTIRYSVERRSIMRALRESDLRLRAIVSNAPVGIYSFDAHGIITFVEGRALEELALVSADIVGQSIFVLFEASDVIVNGVRRVLAGETVHGRIDLKEYVFDCRCSPTYDAAGTLNGAVGVANDVTSRVRAENEREAEREKVASSQRLFESFMANSSSLTFIKDINGRYVYVNESFAATVGMPRSEIVGTVATNIWPHETFDELLEQDRRALESSETLEFTTVVNVSGEPRTLHVVKFVVSDSSGERFLCGKATDVTDRALSELQLRKSEERFHLTALATDDTVYDVDLKTETTWWNENLKRHYGHALAHREYTNDWWHMQLHPDDRPATIASLTAAYAAHKTHWSAEYRFRRADGEYAFVLDRGFIMYEDGVAVRIIGAMIDESERHAADQALKEARDSLEARVRERTAELADAMAQLDQTHRAQTRFIADASHDLRNPLTVVRAEIELLLKRDCHDADTRSALQRVGSEALRLDRLSSDLLMLATLDSGVPQVERTMFRFDELVLETIASLTAFALEREVKWHIRIEDPIVVNCNRGDIERAIFNVLENAVKYSSPHADVAVSLERVRSFAQFVVTDSGAGIPAVDLPQIFDRFFRSDLTRSTSGTGLGLPIVKTVVESHGGKVRASSQVGKGTVVTILLPVALS